MGKIAFVFPGQGAQYSGMGRELSEVSPAAAEIFRQADKLRPETSAQCFNGSEETLQETKVTQPCMFTVELSAAAALTEAGICPDMVAGFSLGELAALTYADMTDFSTGFHLVSKRGALMQEAAELVSTSMAAVVRLSNDVIENICREVGDVYPVNYNCPGQVSVAGLKEKMTEFFSAIRAAGGRAIPLKVSGGFHSPFMAGAAKQFAAVLENVSFAVPCMPLYSDCTGLPYEENVKDLLARQICSPVRWEAIIRHMIHEGVDTFIEVGPGNVLSGLISKIDKNVRTLQVSDQESLKKTILEVKGC